MHTHEYVIMKINNSLLAPVLASLLAFTLTAQGAVISGNTAVESPYFQDKNEKTVTLILHENNSGAKATIPNGTLVKVILETNPSTGFSWNWKCSDESSDVLVFQDKNGGDSSYRLPSTSHLPGAPSKQSWSFLATHPGETVFTFSYGRSWIKEASPLKTIQFDITVE